MLLYAYYIGDKRQRTRANLIKICVINFFYSTLGFISATSDVGYMPGICMCEADVP